MAVAKDFGMIGLAGGCDRQRHTAYVEYDLVQFRPRLIVPEALNQSRGAPDKHRFGEGEPHDAEQDEYEEQGHRAGNPRQVDLQPGGEDGQYQVAEVAQDVRGLPQIHFIREDESSDGDHERDEEFRLPSHAEFRLRARRRKSRCRGRDRPSPSQLFIGGLVAER